MAGPRSRRCRAPYADFHPRDLPHQIARREVDGGVESQNEADVVYGPYETIECDGAQVAALTYRASSDCHQSAGRFRGGKLSSLML